MSSETQVASILRFGAFEVDLRAEELRKQGVRVKLQEQPFLVLKVLLKRPGEIVAREELRSQIWSGDTFVDFDNGLNTAINKLRDALGDSADSPRFIETVPRRGYRFIAPVTGDGQKASATVAVSHGRSRKLVVPVLLLLVGGLLLGVLKWRQGRGGRISSIAVMPFANVNGDPDMEYLSDGLTEGVIDRLSRLPSLKVISRTSAFRYKKRDFEPRRVARELGVEALVTGRVMERADDLFVSAELVDAREDRHLWGEQYSRRLADIGSVQQEIATAISANLQVRITSEKDEILSAKSYNTNAEAYQLYLKGRYYATQGTAEGYKKAIDYFRDAINIDPGNALAYAGLADSYGELGGGLIYQPPRETLPKAKAAARKALELDETVAEAHAALAYAEWFYDWDWSNAEREFKRAIELNPNGTTALRQYSECLGTKARFDESIAEGVRAQELDPLSPRVLGHLAYVYLGAGQYERSIAQHQKALDLDPSAAWIHAQLAWVYAVKGQYSQALAEYDKIPHQDKSVAAENQLVAGSLGWVYAVSGRRADALNLAREFNDLSAHAYVDYYMVATIYSGLGDKDEAFRLLDKAYEERSSSMPYLAVDPFWNGLHPDPRYKSLLRRMGLPQ